MLKIVKATFTDDVFTSEEASSAEQKSVQATHGDGSKLADLWARAAQSLPKESCMDSEAFESLEALYKVRFTSPCLQVRDC